MTVKQITSMIVLLAAIGSLVGGLMAYDATLAKAAEVEQSLSVMAQGIQIQMDTNRMDTLKDQQYKAKRYLLIDPSDADTKEEIKYLDEQIKHLRKRIEQNSMNLGH